MEDHMRITGKITQFFVVLININKKRGSWANVFKFIVGKLRN